VVVEYVETQAPDDDVEGKVLASLANDEPYAFVVCTMGDNGELNLRIASGNSVETIKSILRKALEAMP
jgi:hypothetical protein